MLRGGCVLFVVLFLGCHLLRVRCLLSGVGCLLFGVCRLVSGERCSLLFAVCRAWRLLSVVCDKYLLVGCCCLMCVACCVLRVLVSFVVNCWCLGFVVCHLLCVAC